MKLEYMLCLLTCVVVLARGRSPPHGKIHDPEVMARVVDMAEASLAEPLRSILLYTPPMDSTVVTQVRFATSSIYAQ